MTVRRPTEYFSANARLDSPSTRASRRIAAYNSTLETGTYAPLLPGTPQCSNRNPASGVKTH